MKTESRRGVIRWLVKSFVFFVLLPALSLFIFSGDWEWGAAWVYVAVSVVNLVGNALVLIPTSPELLVERSRLQEGTKSWDRLLSASMALFGPLLMLLVAGLDRGAGGAVQGSLAGQAVALVAMVLGMGLGLWAVGSNAFFSGTVRIQEDRGHEVVTGGPYRFVRHPGYVAAILFDLATPVLLGSLWALVPAAVTVVVIVVRTALEDRTLQAELPGYVEYVRNTRYRLVPGVW
ncbi:MAG: isoprenylcysteine carboxylmethyltransferase family protein [Anaerolineae bacterium]|nr:isoprenylcysteine carboxylmethyltransferase family protein [Anaerolineae bacterium]